MPTNSGVGYFIYVDDVSQVYSYAVPKGGNMFFMHKTQPYLYIKSVDFFNNTSLSTYSLSEVKEQAPAQTFSQPQARPQAQTQAQTENQYVTKSEIADLIEQAVSNAFKKL